MKKLTIEPLLKTTQRDVIVEWMKWSGVLDTKLVDFLDVNTVKEGHCTRCGTSCRASGWCGECYSYSGYRGNPKDANTEESKEPRYLQVEGYCGTCAYFHREPRCEGGICGFYTNKPQVEIGYSCEEYETSKEYESYFEEQPKQDIHSDCGYPERE